MDQLPRKLGVLDATFIVIGIIIGSGIFLLPNVIARDLHSGPVILAVWTVAGVLSFSGALAYAELGAMMPETGGQYVYLREAFGPGCAFVSGWVFMLAANPGGIAFLAVGFSMYLAEFVPLSSTARTLVSLVLVIVLTAANYVGVKEGAWIQRIFTSAKMAGLLLIIGAAVLSPGTPHHAAAPATLSYSGIGFAMTACLMAYNGWSYVSFVAGEVRNPQRNIPRSLALGMVAVMALYLSANLAYMNVLSIPEIAASERVGAAVAERTLGAAGGRLLSVIVMLSVIGAINGCILTGPRIAFAQARDGIFFAPFGRIHPRFETPGVSILALGVWTCVLIVTGTYETLAAYTILSAWLFYTLCVIAVWVLRRKMPDLPRPYRMWGYPWTLWAFVAVSAWYMIDALVNQPRTSLIALGVALAGIPLYLIWRKGAAHASAVPAADIIDIP